MMTKASLGGIGSFPLLSRQEQTNMFHARSCQDVSDDRWEMARKSVPR